MDSTSGSVDRNVIARLVNKETRSAYSTGGSYNPPTTSSDAGDSSNDEAEPKYHVGIIGAGMAGLYTAMILKYLGIGYEILEASDRIGGRVYTHRFSETAGDYYDVGAMRFPDTPEMKRTFDLFTRLGITKNTTDVQNTGDLIPYYVVGPKTPAYYNNRHCHGETPDLENNMDPLMVQPPAPLQANMDAHYWGSEKGGDVPVDYIKAGPEYVIELVLGNWRDKYQRNPKKTWQKLLEKDRLATTVRQEIMLRLAKTDGTLTTRDCYSIAQWCETMTSSTCRFDGAFLECFMHSVDFSYPADPATVKMNCQTFWNFVACKPHDPSSTINNGWWCLNGGAGIITQRMIQEVGNGNITKNARVTAIWRHPVSDIRPMRVRVQLKENTIKKKFSHVITTTTTPCLRVMDLSQAGLRTDQTEAIRALRYEAAVKFGIHFTKKWWITKGITKGGQGKTDRPTRVVVYPSYALNSPADEPGVLLACYNASTDAIRMGALARGDDPTNQPLILEVVLRDLAVMHDVPYDTLKKLATKHHFHDWSRDEFTGGAWGEFAPGQFSHFLAGLQIPAAGGNLFFAGELTCINHGWIVAALHSAHRAVALMLQREGDKQKLQELFEHWWDVDGHDSESLQGLLDRTLGGLR